MVILLLSLCGIIFGTWSFFRKRSRAQFFLAVLVGVVPMIIVSVHVYRMSLARAMIGCGQSGQVIDSTSGDENGGSSLSAKINGSVVIADIAYK